MRELVMNSGGAHGADTAWDFYARKYGVSDIRHYRDQNNSVLSKPLNNKGIKASIVTKEQLDFARDQIYRMLGIKYNDDIKGNLQARNYYQVSNSDAVFAIAFMNDNRNSVSGGTNTAVQLGISMKKPVHVFDIKSEQWYKYNPQTTKFEVEDTPMLTKSFAGVGTRDIEDYQVLKDGKWQSRPQYVGEEKAKIALKAIQDVMAKTQSALNDNRKQPGSNTVTPIQTSYLNVYSGTGDNIYLSNFANRPFETKLGIFNTVEGAFQAAKLYYTNGNKYVIRDHNGKVTKLTEEGMSVVNKLKTAAGSTARNIGRNISNLNINEWNNNSDKILEIFMRMSFEQNPEARKDLTNTGDSVITHKNQQGIEQDNGRFSRLLTKLREEFKSLLPDTDSTDNVSNSTSPTNKLPKNYNQALKQIEKWFDINDQTTNILGNNNIKHAIQELHIEINDEYLISQMNEKDVLNLLYKTSKFLDEMQKLGNTGITIVSEDYFYGDFAKKVKHLTGEIISDIENNYDIQEGEKEKTMEIPNPLIKILGFMESLNYKQREALDRIFEYPIYDLNPAVIGPIDLSDKITITDTVEDTRQTDFLKELGMSDEDMKKAQEIKNHCKGGK